MPFTQHILWRSVLVHAPVAALHSHLVLRVISGVGVTGGGTRDEADVTSDYSKKRKSRNGRRKQWVREVEDINHCVKRTRCWGSQRGGRAVIDYYMNM